MPTSFISSPLNHFSAKHGGLDHLDNSFLDYPKQENSWMDEYFDFQVIEEYMYPSQKRLLHFSKTQSLPIPLEFLGILQIVAPSVLPLRSISIFHNFQKHLLTLLKKAITIKKYELINVPFGIVAYDLWKVFLRCSVPSKKILFIIFGVQVKENEAILRKLSETIPSLRRIILRQDVSVIEQSQTLLRSIVHRKASQLDRSTLQSQCKMKDFPMFYSYFEEFVKELSEGVISQRVGKIQKGRINVPHV